MAETVIDVVLDITDKTESELVLLGMTEADRKELELELELELMEEEEA